ncbi:hypothetical protein LOD99_13235 [Oopsacas minuta]|uniref:Uncharacterized protein n=1 Tax=Oopsacas minuta TaxID=111878 RepID=A0AAV7JBE3_9METZ|nr:hypothetical protein LOD99_13235 [Oopsacas minuta]
MYKFLGTPLGNMFRLFILVIFILCHLHVAFTTNGTCTDNSTCLDHSSCVSLQCQCDAGYASHFINNTFCDIVLATTCNQDYCLICGPYNACYKCRKQKYLDPESDSCIDECPHGYLLEKIEYDNSTFGRLICITATSEPSSAPNWVFAVLAVILLLILIVVIIVIVYLFLTRYNTLIPNMSHRQRSFELSTVEANTRAGAIASSRKDPSIQIVRGLVKTDKASPAKAPSIPDSNTDTKSIISDTDVTSIQSQDSVSATNPGFERESNLEKVGELFNDKLNLLRERAPTFLQMLNDMRRRLKELPADHENVQQYKAVMRDVTRLLYLLNKRPENVEIPPDGIKLLSWAERILQRYIAAQEEARRVAREKRQPANEPAKPRVSMILGEQDETKF